VAIALSSPERIAHTSDVSLTPAFNSAPDKRYLILSEVRPQSLPRIAAGGVTFEPSARVSQPAEERE